MEKGKNVGTPTVAGRQMSSSLKERLKKCGRYHNSPKPGTPVAKQQQSKVSLTPVEGHLSRMNSAHSKIESGSTPVIKRCASSPLCDRPREKRRIMGHSELIVPRKLDDLLSEDVSDRDEEKDEALSISKEPESERSSDTFHMTDKIIESKRCSENMQAVIKSTKTSGSASKMGNPVLESNSRTCVKDKQNNECNLVVDEKTATQSSNGGKGRNENPKPVYQTGNTNLVSEKKMLLMRELEEKEEQLRKLKMVKMYREKNNLEELRGLISKWRSVSQQALQDLHELMSEPKPTMTQLVDHLGIPYELVNFDPDNESFN